MRRSRHWQSTKSSGFQPRTDPRRDAKWGRAKWVPNGDGRIFAILMPRTLPLLVGTDGAILARGVYLGFGAACLASRGCILLDLFVGPPSVSFFRSGSHHIGLSTDC